MVQNVAKGPILHAKTPMLPRILVFTESFSYIWDLGGLKFQLDFQKQVEPNVIPDILSKVPFSQID